MNCEIETFCNSISNLILTDETYLQRLKDNLIEQITVEQRNLHENITTLNDAGLSILIPEERDQVRRKIILIRYIIRLVNVFL